MIFQQTVWRNTINQDNKGQPQQGDQNNKPGQQGQQPAQNPGQQTQQPSQKPSQDANKTEFERAPPSGGVLVFRLLRSQPFRDNGMGL